MNVAVVDASLTRELRRSVLRPHLTVDDPLPGDDLPEAVHLAVLDDDGAPLSTCFVYEEDPPQAGGAPSAWRPGEPAWRLRQMATAPDVRGAGHGRALVTAAARYVRDHGAALLWCDARESAAGFYERCGWQRHGEVFTDADHPVPHVRMGIGIAAQRVFGFVGAIVVLVGLLPVLISLTAAEWFTGIPLAINERVFVAPAHPTFGQVSDLIGHVAGRAALADAYFGWLAWVLVALVFAFAVVAITPGPAQRVFRVLAPLAAAGAIAATTLALNLFAGGNFGFWWGLRGVAYWLAVAGFAVMGAGAALGPAGGLWVQRTMRD